MTRAQERTLVGLDLLQRRRADYVTGPRLDVIRQLPAPVGRVLDIGCGEGAGAPALRERGATELVGVELDPVAAARASTRYDEVIVRSVEEARDWEARRFDTVLCYDVLEHLYDPWSVLAWIRPLLAPHGALHISIPNVRHRSAISSLLLRGSFAYAPDGLLDVTHIRFFTRADIVRAVNARGFRIESIATPAAARPASRAFRRLTHDAFLEFTALQWFVLARPA